MANNITINEDQSSRDGKVDLVSACLVPAASADTGHPHGGQCAAQSDMTTEDADCPPPRPRPGITLLGLGCLQAALLLEVLTFSECCCMEGSRLSHYLRRSDAECLTMLGNPC